MAKNATSWFLAAGIVILGGLPACRDRGPLPGKSVVQPRQVQSGKLLVRILPETPTSSDDLQAIYTGEGSAVYRWELNGRPLEGAVDAKLARTSFKKRDRVAVIVSVQGEEGRASVVIGNSPPEVTSVPFSPEYIHRGVDIAVTPVAVDPDGEDVAFSYQWAVNGREVPGDAPVLPADRFKKGDQVSLRITPVDADGPGKIFQSKTIVIPNAPPSFTTTPPSDFSGTVYSYRVKAVDPDGDPVTYSLAAAPVGMTIQDSSGEITWSIGSGSGGRHPIEITARDSDGAQSVQKYVLTITIPGEVR